MKHEYRGDIHPIMTCDRIIEKQQRCTALRKWHPIIKKYTLCTNPECPWYYICRCGVEVGKHNMT